VAFFAALFFLVRTYFAPIFLKTFLQIKKHGKINPLLARITFIFSQSVL